MNIEKLRTHISYDPSTGIMTWKKVLSNRGVVGAECGSNVDSKGYKRVCFEGKQYRAHRVVWAMHYGEIPSFQIDHINGDRSDNRICNLRLASNQENSFNTRIKKNNTSGYTGVTWSQNAKKRMAQIMVNNKHIYLGTFADKNVAVQTRSKATKEYFGVFAKGVA